MSLLVVPELLGLFETTLTAHRKYSTSIIIKIKSLFEVGSIIKDNKKFTWIA